MVLELTYTRTAWNRGIPRSKETREKISKALRGKKHTQKTKEKISVAMQGKTPWNKGLKLGRISIEHRQKISDAMKKSAPWKGKKLPEYLRQKLSQAKKGRKLSETHKQQLRLALIGRPVSSLTREKIGKAFRGRKLSLELRKKLSDKRKEFFTSGGRHPMKGKSHSQETIEKIRRARALQMPPSPMKGKHHSDKTKEKIREKRLKQVFPKKDTLIERLIQNELTQIGLSFRTHFPIAGICQADIAIPEEKIAIFCDGDYWHANPRFYSSERLNKTQVNTLAYDKRNETHLKAHGWKVLRFWEYDILNNLQSVMNKCLG